MASETARPSAPPPPSPSHPSLAELAHRVELLGRDCPWTAEQTPASVLAFLRSECDELEEALAAGASSAELASELGDVLFNAMLAVEVCAREGEGNGRWEGVTLDAVAAASLSKLRRRYPPLFDGTLAQLDGVEEGARLWREGKEGERASTT